MKYCEYAPSCLYYKSFYGHNLQIFVKKFNSAGPWCQFRNVHNKLECFSLVFGGKARAYPTEANFR
jgi:hypothetical protein